MSHAGFLPTPSTILDSNSAEFWKGFEINVQGNVNVVQAFAPHAAANPTVIGVGTVSNF